jgi:hypothetical protein
VLPDVQQGKVEWAVAFLPYRGRRGGISYTEDFVFPKALVIEAIAGESKVDDQEG